MLAYSSLSDSQKKLYNELKVATESGSYPKNVFGGKLQKDIDAVLSKEMTGLCCIARYTVGKLQKFMQQFQT